MMNRRRIIQLAPYVLAAILTIVMMIPSLTAAQEDEDSLRNNRTAAGSGGGWKKQGSNVYITSGNVGIGAKPRSRDDLQLQIKSREGDVGLLLQSLNDSVSSILLREHDLQYGITISYDGSVTKPDDGASSGLFGIWRVNATDVGASPLFSAYRHSDNVGIGALPSDRSDVRLTVGGHQIIQGPEGWESGSVARLYLGDYSHYIQSTYGVGIQFSPSRAPAAVTIHEETGYVGIGTGYTASPRAKLEIAGNSGVEGLHLSLKEDEGPYSGHNSPMIKWDSTAYVDAQGGQPVNRIWYARSQGNDWILASSGESYDGVNVVIKASPDGEVCIGSDC